jgi:response regulator RpfG family c-di-GMP phosphodiesterase/DNA-directed RNA polymerase subunit RPC12/RpoP
MDLTCRKCGARFRAAIETPLTQPVRVQCPACSHQMVLKPSVAAGFSRPESAPPDSRLKPAATPRRRVAVIADEPRPFRAFLVEQLHKVGFEVSIFETGDPALDFIRRTHADVVIVNVYLKGKLGVEVSEEIKNDASLEHTRVILIGALFRANRFRANPTNLYGADEYIEEAIPEREFRQIIHKFFPELGPPEELPVESQEYAEARRLARLILSDIVIYHPAKVDQGIRDNSFFELLHAEIEEGRQYYESRVPMRVRRDTEIFSETLQQFVQMKREEMEKVRTGT